VKEVGMGQRRTAREIALQTLYSAEMTGDFPDVVFENVRTMRKFADEAGDYARKLALMVYENREECDRLIRESAEHWEFSRIALIDRLILRIGICEFLYGENVPPRVVIDEAIELAKKYSSEKSGGFINGILDAIVKKSGRLQQKKDIIL
jgi:N utilization substance protein B